MKLWIVIAALAVAAPLRAQNGVPSPRGWSLAIMGGGTAFTDFQRSTIQAMGVSPAGGLEQRDFPRRVTAKTAGALAATLAYWPSKNWGLRFFGAYSPSRFETVIAESDADFMNMPRSSEETGALAPLAVMSYDLQALFRLPTIRQRIMPYGFVGGGVVRYRVSPAEGPVPEEASTDFATGTRTKPALRIGAGALLPLRHAGWGLTFELNDQIARTPLPNGGDRTVDVTNALTFMVGLRLAL